MTPDIEAGTPSDGGVVSGDADGRRVITDWAHTEGIDLGEGRGHDLCILGVPCVIVSPYSPPDVYLRWIRPHSPGNYRLADLQAEICESTAPATTNWLCAPLNGNLQVRAITPPCADGTCGHLDADLVLAERPIPPPSGPFAFGQAHLLYEVMHSARSCTSGGFGGVPSGGLN